MKILILIFFSLLSALLYRLGGIGKPFNTLYRDLGTPLVTLLAFLILGGQFVWWIWLLCFILMFISMTTYWKGNAPDVLWYHWLFTGLAYGFSMLPYAFLGHWVGFILRTGILGLLTMIWSEKNNNDTLEELGRGFLVTITIPLLL